MEYPELNESDALTNRYAPQVSEYPPLQRESSSSNPKSFPVEKSSIFNIDWHFRGCLLNVLLWIAIILPFWLDLSFRIRLTDFEFNIISFWNKFWPVFIVLYLLYLTECFTCRMVKQLYNILSAKKALEYILELKRQRPEITITSESFHYEFVENSPLSSNLSEVTAKRGNERKRNEFSERAIAQKVVTHVDKVKFEFANFYDDSGMLDNDINFYQIIRLTLEKTFDLGDAKTEQAFNEQLTAFLNKNRLLDSNLIHEISIEIPTFQKEILCIKNAKSGRFVGLGTYAFFSTVLLLSWPYRIFIEMISFRKKFVIKKIIYH